MELKLWNVYFLHSQHKFAQTGFSTGRLSLKNAILQSNHHILPHSMHDDFNEMKRNDIIIQLKSRVSRLFTAADKMDISKARVVSQK